MKITKIVILILCHIFCYLTFFKYMCMCCLTICGLLDVDQNTFFLLIDFYLCLLILQILPRGIFILRSSAFRFTMRFGYGPKKTTTDDLQKFATVSVWFVICICKVYLRMYMSAHVAMALTFRLLHHCLIFQNYEIRQLLARPTTILLFCIIPGCKFYYCSYIRICLRSLS